MKITNLLFGLLITTSFVFGQNWQKQYGIPQTGYNVNSVKAFDANTVYYMNTRGDFSKSLDGGTTWSSTKVLDGSLSNAFYFFDINNGWVADYNGGIMHTSDAGNTWSHQTSGVNSFIRNFYFITSITGWAVGSGEVTGELLKTSDGGQTWIKQSLPQNNTLTIYSVKFINSLTGWVLGYRGNDYFLYNTTNGGTNWTLLPDPNTMRDVGFFNLMQFLDEQKGFIVDQFGGFIYKTTNGGKSFTKLPNPAAIGTVQNFGFVNELVGYTTDDQANIFKTLDGGLSWTQQTSGVPSGTLNGLSVVDANTAFVAGLSHQLKTTDGGSNWLKIGDENIVFRSISPLNSTLGYAVGDAGKILKTTNGTSWTKQLVNNASNLNSVKFINDNEGIVVGNNGTILKTINGGIAIGTSSGWNLITLSGISKNLNAVDFIDANEGFIVGDAYSSIPGMGNVLRTLDGGISWSSVTGINSQNLKDIQLFDANLGWALGAKGTILKYDGTSWPTVTSGITTDLNALYFVSSLVGYAVGASNKILKSVDGGSSWTAQTSPLASTLQLNDVFFTDENNGWIVGNATISVANSSFAAMLRTTDGGATWKRVFNEISFNLNSIKFLDVNNGWAAGAGSISKYTAAPYLETVNIPTSPALSFNYTQTMPMFMVRVLNADGSLNTGYNNTISVAQVGGTAAMSGTTTQTALNGEATFSGLQFNRPANALILQASAGALKVYSPAFVTTATGASKLVFARVYPSVMTNATIASFIVVAQDANNFNSLAAYGTKTITLSGISGTGTVLGTLIKNTSNGSVSFSNISFNKRGTYTLMATDGVFSVTSSPIVVGATQLSISGISNDIKKENTAIEPVFVSALDAQRKLDNSFNETVTIEQYNANGTITGIVTVTAVNGIATFSGLTFNRNGIYTLVATSFDLSTATSAPINIDIKATKLQLSINGSTTVGVNSTLGSTFIVSAVNDFYQLDVNYNGAINLLKAEGTGSVSGLNPVNAVNGVASISGLSFSEQGLYVFSITGNSVAGTSFSIFVTSTLGNGSLTGVVFSKQVSDVISVYPNPSSGFVTFTFPSNISGEIQLIITDVSGNIIEKIETSYEEAGLKQHLYLPQSNLPNGTYFYHIKGVNFNYSGKLILINK